MSGTTAKSLVDPTLLIASILKGDPISFDLSAVFDGQARVRLRSVGMSFGNALSENMDPGRIHYVSAYRLRAMISLPSMVSGSTSISRPPLLFGNIAVYSGAAPLASNSSAVCYNVSPKGKWAVRFAARAVHSLAYETKLKDLIFDLKLHLSVVATIAPNAKLGPVFSNDLP